VKYMGLWVLRFVSGVDGGRVLPGGGRPVRGCLSILIASAVLSAGVAARGGLIGHWRLDEGAGAGTAADSGVLGHDGVYHGSPNLNAAGLAGTGMDSSGGYMTADLGGDLPTGAAVRTISLFVKPSESNNRKFIGYGDTPAGTAFEFTTEEYNSQMGVRFRHWGGNYHYGGITIGAWNHVGIRVGSGATHVGDVEVFIDGVEVAGVISGGSNVELNTAASELHVGTAAVGAESGSPFNGVIDDVQLYDEALSDEQIEWLCNNPGQIISQDPQAVNPSPADGAWRVTLDAVLSWEAGFVEGFVPAYNVYFGTDAGDLPRVSSRQSDKSYDPEGDLTEQTRYYWRVDLLEPTGRGSFAEHPGELWSFTSWYDSMKVVEWKLEDGWEHEGGLYTGDGSGQGNDGLAQGYIEPDGPRWVAGVDGNCLELAGAGEYVANDEAANLPLDETYGWTMNLYLQLDERARDWTGIAGFGDPWRRELIICREREIGFVYEGEYLILSGARAGVGVWRMVTVVRDANSIAILVDGVERASRELPLSEADAIGEEVNLLSYAGSERFAGKIDEFTVWDGVVSAEEIEAMAEKLPRRGDFDGDKEVGNCDFAELGRWWHSDTRAAAEELVLDDIEGYSGAGDPCLAALWAVCEGSPGTSTLSLVTDTAQSHGGDQAMRWDYDFGVGRVVGFDYWLKNGRIDLSEYDQLRLWIYGAAGSTGGRLWCKLLVRDEVEDEVVDIAEAWYPGGVEGIVEGEWIEWVIELDEVHTWDSSDAVIPCDRIEGLAGLSIGGYCKDGGAGTIYLDDIHLVGTRARCRRELLVGADSNGDCRVDFRDLGALALDWLGSQ